MGHLELPDSEPKPWLVLGYDTACVDSVLRYDYNLRGPNMATGPRSYRNEKDEPVIRHITGRSGYQGAGYRGGTLFVLLKPHQWWATDPWILDAINNLRSYGFTVLPLLDTRTAEAYARFNNEDNSL